MNGEDKAEILKLKTKKRLFKSKTIDEIYNTLSDDSKDSDCDLVSPFEIFKALINSIILVQKLFKYGYDKKHMLFFVLEKVIEQNIPQDYYHVYMSLVKLLKQKYFDVYLALLKFNFKEKCSCCCKKKKALTVKESNFYRA